MIRSRHMRLRSTRGSRSCLYGEKTSAALSRVFITSQWKPRSCNHKIYSGVTMHCQNCQNLHFEPLDLVQKLVSAEKPLAQALGTTLAFTRKAIVKAGSTKKFGDRIIGTINSLPTSVKTNLSNPTGSAEVLHNSVCIVHQSLQALKLSAEYGCQFCRLLWGGLREPIASPKSKNHSSSSEVRLFLSAYRDINVEKSLSILTNQYIIAECGQDRSMCLDITAGSFGKCYC